MLLALREFGKYGRSDDQIRSVLIEAMSRNLASAEIQVNAYFFCISFMHCETAEKQMKALWST